MQLIPCWNRWPERLQFELVELRDAGIRFALDEKLKQNGIIRVTVWPKIGGEEVKLVATYPDLYPHFRFEIQAPSLELPYHQNPFLKNLCFLGRWTAYWDQDFTLLAMLREQVPVAIAAGMESEKEAVEKAEEHQAEPLSEYYPYESSSIILINTEWALPPFESAGVFVVGTLPSTRFSGGFRGAVLEVRSHTSKLLLSASTSIRNTFNGPSVHGHWIRSPQPVRESNPFKFLQFAARLDPQAGKIRKNSWNNDLLELWAMVFPQEVRWRDGTHKEGWVFVAHLEQKAHTSWSWMNPSGFQWYGSTGRGSEQ